MCPKTPFIWLAPRQSCISVALMKAADSEKTQKLICSSRQAKEEKKGLHRVIWSAALFPHSVFLGLCFGRHCQNWLLCGFCAYSFTKSPCHSHAKSCTLIWILFLPQYPIFLCNILCPGFWVLSVPISSVSLCLFGCYITPPITFIPANAESVKLRVKAMQIKQFVKCNYVYSNILRGNLNRFFARHL